MHLNQILHPLHSHYHHCKKTLPLTERIPRASLRRCSALSIPTTVRRIPPAKIAFGPRRADGPTNALRPHNSLLIHPSSYLPRVCDRRLLFTISAKTICARAHTDAPALLLLLSSLYTGARINFGRGCAALLCVLGRS